MIVQFYRELHEEHKKKYHELGLKSIQSCCWLGKLCQPLLLMFKDKEIGQLFNIKKLEVVCSIVNYVFQISNFFLRPTLTEKNKVDTNL